MKLLKWALGGASAYVIYKYSIGRKAKGEDVFVTAEKAVEKIAGEIAPKKPARKKTTATKASAPEAALPADAEKPKRKRAPRKTAPKPPEKSPA